MIQWKLLQGLLDCMHDFDDFFQGADEPTAEEKQSATTVKVPPRLGLLANLDQKQFDAVARAAKLKFYEADASVFEQGDAADRFFILVDGNADVIRDGKVIGTLGPGSFFGESALLVHGNRSATVQTTSPSSMWSVDYETFSSVVSDQLLADENARKEVEQRLKNTPTDSFE